MTPDELRAAIERATADLDGIVAVFQALLRIAEIEAGSRRAAFAALDLAPLLADVAELYERGGRGKGLRLVLDLPAPQPATSAPRLPDRLRTCRRACRPGATAKCCSRRWPT